MRRTSLWVTALALGAAWADPARQSMHVEEPALSHPAPPIDPEREASRWAVGKGSQDGLSPTELASLRERRRKMEEMRAAIREKREALAKAGAGEKDQRIDELEALILDKDKRGQRSEMSEEKQRKNSEAKEKALEKALQKILEKEKKKEKKKGNSGQDP